MRDVGDDAALREQNQVVGEGAEISQTVGHVGEVDDAVNGRVARDGVFLRERKMIGYVQTPRLAVLYFPRALPPRGPIEFVQFGHSQHAKNGFARENGSNGDAPERNAAREIGGAVNGINDPRRRVGIACQAGFFAQETPSRRDLRETFVQEFFDGSVGGGDERIVAFEFRGRAAHREREGVGFSRDGEGIVGRKRQRKIGHGGSLYSLSMHKVALPRLFENMEEATIGRWLVREGETVSPDTPLCEVITEKTTLEMPGEVAGVVRKLLVPEKAVVPAGFVLALVGEADEPLPDVSAENAALQTPEAPPVAVPIPSSNTAPETPPSGSRLRATPAARRAAKELGVD